MTYIRVTFTIIIMSKWCLHWRDVASDDALLKVS